MLTITLALFIAQDARGTDGNPAAIVVLQDTGRVEGNLPIVEPHPDAARHESALSRGFSGRLLRLYAVVQRMVHPGRAPEPAYLVLTGNEGGFPRHGFVLAGIRREGVAWVDLHRRKRLTGRYGAIDQIFPHELLHIVVELLAGKRPSGGSNQVHAIGVTTDRVTAFDEGFAEHAQLMAVEAAGAMPETRALMSDVRGREQALYRFEEYRRARTARWNVGSRAILTFPAWFSSEEQALRYHAVRDNRFAFEVPGDLTHAAAYDAYLLENTLPGDPAASRMRASRLVAREGVVSALFYRLATTPQLQHTGSQSLDDVYLRMFAAIREGRYDAAAVVRAWLRLFPGDAPAVAAVVRNVLGELPGDEPSIWIENPRLIVGTSLFDQYRALPRPHTFDLNACSIADLMAISGMTVDAARGIISGAPYRFAGDVRRVAAVSADLAATIETLSRDTQRARADDVERSVALSLTSLLRPYLVRAAILLAIATCAGALVQRRVRRLRWMRAVLDGFAGAFIGLLVGWSVDQGTGVLAFIAPVLLLGVPASVWRAVRVRSASDGLRVFAAWAAAALIPALIVRPLF